VDPAGQVSRVNAYLPRRWSTRRYPTLYDVAQPDLLVLGGATPFLAAAARLLHREATIIGVIAADAPARDLVDILHAGADACVRASAPHVLAGHLIALHDRRELRAHPRRTAGAAA
jgi:hypothetical protein